jgi:hypothetical protein
MLTADQRALFELRRPDQDAATPAKRQYAAVDFQHGCQLELGVAPELADVLAEIDARRAE